jgi:hypothetical protein
MVRFTDSIADEQPTATRKVQLSGGQTMTRDDIIRLAREACDKDKVDPYQNDFWAITQEELERFAALVAAAERDSILKMSAENWYKTQADYDAAIRARGESK